MGADGDAARRERLFWDDHVPSLDQVVAAFRRGPDPNTALMLDAVEPVQGRRVLDFACGAGLTSAWLAARGADVTGIDISPASIERAREVVEHLGLEARFVAGDVDSALGDETFERVVGRWALHHVDTAAVGRALSARLAESGVGAFHETFGLNPVLRFARRRLMWLPGLTRFGSVDEHPLEERDIADLRDAFGHAELRVAHMTFVRILDRNVFRHRRTRARRLAGAIDDRLLARGLGKWSYHQVLYVSR
ncbi:MAG TPA: methyltransferase domain-containing protein [Solirubrobacteraceae bacterium]|jgi:SAM-dependent methyltransferase|nr:methyltransferase domain-containing protein [Solirubrobacteraceae bacterium]